MNGILRGLEVNDVVFINPIYLPNGSLLSGGKYKITRIASESSANNPEEKTFKYTLSMESSSKIIHDVPDFIPCDFIHNDIDETDFQKSVKDFDGENK